MQRAVRAASVAVVALLVVARPARAHQQSIQNVEVAAHGGAIDVRVLVYPSDVLDARDRAVTPADLIAQHDAVAKAVTAWVIAGDDRGPCAAGPASVVAADDPHFGEVRWTARCSAPIDTLVLDFRGLFALDRSLEALVKVDGLDEDYTPLVRARDPILRVPLGEPPPSTLLAYVRTGVDHIFGGRDHICFILALLLVVLLARGPDGGWRQKPLVPALRTTAGIVTAFTIAHSLTLISASLGWVSLPSRFVESMIALSIAYTAIEDIVRPDVRWRFALTFGFGLVHGLGFASVLARLLPPHDVVVPLLAFNVGVELGQLAIVCVALPTFALVCRAVGAERYRRVVMPIAAAAIALLGAIWLVERVAGVTILGL